MEYRMTQVWPVAPSSLAPFAVVTMEEVESHMAKWTDAGWQLHTMNTNMAQMGAGTFHVYTFVWQREPLLGDQPG